MASSSDKLTPLQRALLEAFFRVESRFFLTGGGCTPAALAWVLAEVSIPDGLDLPGGVPAAELRQFVADLIVRLRRAAFPVSDGT